MESKKFAEWTKAPMARIGLGLVGGLLTVAWAYANIYDTVEAFAANSGNEQYGSALARFIGNGAPLNLKFWLLSGAITTLSAATRKN